jgi:hypothetical protein
MNCIYIYYITITIIINKISIQKKIFVFLTTSSQNIDANNSIYSKYLKNNLKYWTSGNERINTFIQEKQLKIKDYNDVVFEWIPYNQFNKIKETGRNDLITLYSTIWKDGPLQYKKYINMYTRVGIGINFTIIEFIKNQ